uniref:Frizzled and smoothened-like protein O n=1 Tax=Talaromyces marneffei PM1 TaxID=1077442 RepID=A0A093UXB2_TALMA
MVSHHLSKTGSSHLVAFLLTRALLGVDSKITAVGWLAVALLPLTIFLFVSYAVLPVKFTNRNYITVCFTLSCVCLQIPFIIPLGTKPQQCNDPITPNDMNTDWSCAFTGAILLFGGIACVTWSLLRTIALHLQVCWEVVIGPVFMWISFAVGLGVPVLILTLMLVFTGVSYRFGGVCHINSKNSLHDYWLPALVFGGMGLVLQFVTMGYCIHVYIRALFDPADPTSTSNSGLPSYASSSRTATARQAYKRVQRVLKLQWRSMALVMVILANVIYLSVTFLQLDSDLTLNAANLAKAQPWLTCLATLRDPTKCASEASALGLTEAALDAALVLLCIASFWNFIFTVRMNMFQGWLEFWQGLFAKNVEFVSVDARSRFGDNRNYEMLSHQNTTKTPEPTPFEVRSPTPAYMHGRSDEDDVDGKDIELSNHSRQASYTRPTMSFSTPRPPTAQRNPTNYTWDATSTFARSNSQMSNHNPRYK